MKATSLSIKSIVLPLVLTGSLHAAETRTIPVDPEAAWWLHADLEAVGETRPGKHVASVLRETYGDQLRSMELMFSVDPLADISGITLYGDGRDERAVALIAGSLDREHLTGIVRGADAHETRDHAGFTVHRWQDDGKFKHAAFAADDLLVFSETGELVDHALEVIRDRESVELPTAESDDHRRFLWGMARMSEIEAEEEHSRVLAKTKMLRIGLSEVGNRMRLDLELTAARARDAERFQNVLEGLVAIGQLGDPSGDMEKVELVAAAEGRDVSATLTMPSRLMIRWIDEGEVIAKIGGQ